MDAPGKLTRNLAGIYFIAMEVVHLPCQPLRPRTPLRAPGTKEKRGGGDAAPSVTPEGDALCSASAEGTLGGTPAGGTLGGASTIETAGVTPTGSTPTGSTTGDGTPGDGPATVTPGGT